MSAALPAGAGVIARTWFDAFVAMLPPERVRVVTAADGSTRLSIELREGAIADALRDAMHAHVRAADADAAQTLTIAAAEA